MFSRASYTNFSSVQHRPAIYEQPCHRPCYPLQSYSSSSKQSLDRLRREIKQLQDHQSGLQLQMQELQERSERTKASLMEKITKANQLQNILAPISRLPSEMLLAIFEEAVSNPAPGMEMLVAMNISHVSRCWREVAINSPRLWRHVWVMPGTVGPRVLQMYTERVSGALDVSLSGWRDRKEFQRFDAALDAIIHSSADWRTLSVSYMCDTNLSHLGSKLSKAGPLKALRRFSFRASRPGQICCTSFLTKDSATALRSFDAENFSPTGDLLGNRSRMNETFSRLTALTLRRYSHDNRSLRITIDFNTFRALVNCMPGLTSLALYGQPLRYRIGPSLDGEPTLVSIPQLRTLVLQPGVLKPRYLQQTVSSIHAPALRHFELVFPDSRTSGQSISELLFDAKTKQARFPHVDTVVLHNASNSSTALSFVNAFPYATSVTIGGVDVGFFPQVLRARTYDAYVYHPPRYLYWQYLRVLTLRATKPETLRVVREWISDELDRGQQPIAALIVERPIDNRDLALLYQSSRNYLEIEVVNPTNSPP
ncbi:hypothetical protein ID866_8344 [Astraeus odoratus]|nr:hypothetical protein ID866_8344 [Astraeus odoratus]